MPVTAKLSKAFYEGLGDGIANELVDWFNQVDATYRADLRDLNERNFQRFDARLGERFAESETRFAEFDTRLGERFAESETRFAEFDTRLGERFAEFEIRFAQLDTRLGERIAEFEVRFAQLETRFARLETTLERRINAQTRWLFGAWAMLLIPILGLWFRG
jgi:hypothetical protein